MTSELAHFLAQALGGGIVIAYLLQRKSRRIDYLRSIAGARDLWDRRCGACGRKIRDRASLVVAKPLGGGMHETVFHLGSPRYCDIRRDEETPDA
ncbi:hypothetical protein ACFWIB_14600 [Streptomyces sp. NPDC127051]|uniref:hypothetical protein n=1 Tax=Streptomyces sp. NPDC127051 TaxID=3347119 RepID=UPI00365381FA